MGVVRLPSSGLQILQAQLYIMKKTIITLEVRPTATGFSADVVEPSGIPVMVTAGSLPDLITESREALLFHAEDLTVFGEVTPVLRALHNGDFDVRCRMDVKSFVEVLSSSLGKTGLSDVTGISDVQFWRYQHEGVTPRKKQREKIQSAVHAFGAALQSVDLV